MLPGLTGIAGPASGGSPTLLQALTSLGLTSNLQLVLDAGDINSVATSSQTKWLDTSGNGYDFFRGTSTASQATDPTFNGAPGGQSAAEYYSTDGGDYFAYDTTSETWMNALHKDSATFTIAMWVFFPTAAIGAWLVNTRESGSGPGITLSTVSTSTYLNVLTASGTAFTSSGTPAAGLVLNDWNFVSLRVAEASNTLSFVINGTTTTMACTYTTPSSAAAQLAMTLMGTAAIANDSGTRVSQVAMWQGTALTTTQLTSIYNTTRARY